MLFFFFLFVQRVRKLDFNTSSGGSFQMKHDGYECLQTFHRCSILPFTVLEKINVEYIHIPGQLSLFGL